MGAEVLLYGYGLVCASMLVFNVVYSLHLRSDDRRRYKRMQKLRRRIDGQLRGIQRESAGAPQPVQVSHLTWCAGGSPMSTTCWPSTVCWTSGQSGRRFSRPT